MMYAFCLSCPVRLLLSSLAVLYHAEWVAAKGLFVVLMCCVVLWFKLKYKVKINVQKYCERKRNTANEWTTHLHCFGAKLLTAKEILLIGNYYLVFLKKQR